MEFIHMENPYPVKIHYWTQDTSKHCFTHPLWYGNYKTL